MLGLKGMPQPPFFRLLYFILTNVGLFVCFGSGFLCSPDCPGIYLVDQTDLDLQEIQLPPKLGATIALPKIKKKKVCLICYIMHLNPGYIIPSIWHMMDIQ